MDKVLQTDRDTDRETENHTDERMDGHTDAADNSSMVIQPKG